MRYLTLVFTNMEISSFCMFNLYRYGDMFE